MAYIAPNTTIVFLEKILLKPNYQHTYYFASQADQYNFFYSHRKYEKGTQSYQRVGMGTLRVEMTMEEAYKVNYMMFKNTSFENKWFYAFIDGDPVYINNTTVQISYIIDVMQTWYFDYVLKPSFVERNHSSTDVFGENLEDEGLFTGYVKTIDETDEFSGLQLGAIVTSKPLPNIAYGVVEHPLNYQFAVGAHEIKLYSTYSVQDKTQCGIASTLYFYTGIPLSKFDAYRLSLFPEIRTFSVSNTLILDPNRNWIADPNTPVSIQEILYALNLPLYEWKIFDTNYYIGKRSFYYETSGDINALPDTFNQDKVLFTPEDIIAIYQYPAEFNTITWQQTASSIFENCEQLSLSPIKQIQSPNTIDGYVPHNKKLYTYPYNYVEAADNEGHSEEYKYELGSDSLDTKGINILKYRLYCQTTNNPTSTLVPHEYFGELNNWCHSFTLSNFITCLYYNNAYNTWVLQNSSQNAAKLITGAIQLGTSIAGSPQLSLLGSLATQTEHGHTDTRNHQYQQVNAKSAPRRTDKDWYQGGGVDKMGSKSYNDTPDPYYREHKYDHSSVLESFTPKGKDSWTDNISSQQRGEMSAYLRGGWDSIGLSEKVYGVASLLSQISDAQRLTNSAHAPQNNSIINNGVNKKNFTIKRRQITSNYAQKIDSYFDMYGYKINKVTIPLTYARKYWTFVKTTNCNIGLNSSIPASDVGVIEGVFNSGITFWTRFGGSDIGDYDNDNSISGITPSQPIALIVLKDVNGNGIALSPAFNPLVTSYSASLESDSPIINIQVYGYCDCYLNGTLLHETVDSDPQNMLFNGILQSGSNTITINGTTTYTLSVLYANTQPSFTIDAYRSISPLTPFYFFPVFNEDTFYYTGYFQTFDPNDKYLYFITDGEVDSVIATGTVTHEGDYTKVALVGTANTVTTNTITFNMENGKYYVFSISFDYSVPVSNFFYDSTLTQNVPTSPNTFSTSVTSYSIAKADIPSNRTIYWYRPNTVYQAFSVNGQTITPDSNGIYTCGLYADLQNYVRFTINYVNYEYEIDLR